MLYFTSTCIGIWSVFNLRQRLTSFWYSQHRRSNEGIYCVILSLCKLILSFVTTGPYLWNYKYFLVLLIFAQAAILAWNIKQFVSVNWEESKYLKICFEWNLVPWYTSRYAITFFILSLWWLMTLVGVGQLIHDKNYRNVWTKLPGRIIANCKI